MTQNDTDTKEVLFPNAREVESTDRTTCDECGSPGQIYDDGRRVGCHDCGNSWWIGL